MIGRVVLLLVLLGPLIAPSVAWGAPRSLEAAARMSPRPAGCRTEQGPWQRVQQEAKRRPCAWLALAYAMVDAQPVAARALVDRALSSLASEQSSQRRDPHMSALRTQLALVNARTWLKTGETQQAFDAFAAIEKELRAVRWDAVSLHDYAISAALTGHDQLALDLYRRLVPVVAWLPGLRRQQLALEAAAASLRVDPPAARETLSYLALLKSWAPDRQQVRIRAALMAAARLWLGQGSVPRDEANLLLSEPLKSSPARAVAPALAPSDWLLVDTVAAWSSTGQTDVWQQLDASEARPGHRRLSQRVLQQALP